MKKRSFISEVKKTAKEVQIMNKEKEEEQSSKLEARLMPLAKSYIEHTLRPEIQAAAKKGNMATYFKERKYYAITGINNGKERNVFFKLVFKELNNEGFIVSGTLERHDRSVGRYEDSASDCGVETSWYYAIRIVW